MPEIIAALGWPHFAFAFGVVFLLVFHAQLRALLGRITSIDKTGRLLAFPVDQGITCQWTRAYNSRRRLLSRVVAH